MHLRNIDFLFKTAVIFFLNVSMIFFNLTVFFVSPSHAAENSDFTAAPPFNSFAVKPNVLFVLDNSNSMDEDVNGEAVGSNSPLSRSEIARHAIQEVIADNQTNMRFGLMAYKQQNIVHMNLHNSFYYCNYDPSTYDPNGVPTPKDPHTNTKRFPNPLDPGNYIYYDTALPFYTNGTQPTFCYSYDFTYADPGTCSSTNSAPCHRYYCFGKKTGTVSTPDPVPYFSTTALQNSPYFYSNYLGNWLFWPTDSDIAAGFHEFGLENASAYVGPTWFSNSSPGPGMLHSAIADSTSAHITGLNSLLGTSQFVTNTDVPLRNAGLTPLAGTMASAKKYYMGSLPSSEAKNGISRISPIQYRCQKSFVVLVTDGLPSTDKNGNAGNSNALLTELETEISALRNTSVPGFTDSFDIKTFVIGFALPPGSGSKLDDLAVAGGTDVNGKAILADDAAELRQKMKEIFNVISDSVASGTAASVVSNTRSGEGVVYQSLFFPEYKDSENKTIQWVGKVQAYMVDDQGNMRVDMYYNKNLDKVVIEDALSSGYKQLNIRNEDLNYNSDPVTNTNMSHEQHLDEIAYGIDLNLNGSLESDIDEPDYDGDGKLDYRDLIIVFRDGKVDLWDDANENNIRDDEDQTRFTPDIPLWHGNGVLDTEDTNGNGTLDSGEDINGNGNLDSEDLNGNGILDSELVRSDYPVDEIQPLWSSQDWLDSSSFSPLSQRGYTDTSDQRYIITFVDANNDMIAESNEIFDFATPILPSIGDLTDTSNFLSYLNLYPSFSDKPGWVTSIETEGNKDTFLVNQVERVVNFVRGEDQSSTTIGTVTVPKMRSRQYKLTGGLDKTWRLGDIVSSSPTVVNRPAEGYHLIYRDDSYAEFVARYLNRRSVIYVGGNDGMIHAFNGGFYDRQKRKFLTRMAEPFIDAPDGSGNYNGVYDTGEKFSDLNNDGVWNDAVQTDYSLGAELWAYVPFNLLPHLYWLTEENYEHVYYNDLTPKIFDAKIFTEEGDCNLTPVGNSCVHPEGWGTLMVVGMRFGGGNIIADTNRNDAVDLTDKKMSSAYVIFDITNPEEPPKVLAEITLPSQGYTTCYPAVVPIRGKKTSPATGRNNDWYLVFGSGPADGSGFAASRDVLAQVLTSGTVGDDDILENAESKQTGRLYVMNLSALTDGLSPHIEVLNDNGESAVWLWDNAAHLGKFVEKNNPSVDSTSFIENFDGDESLLSDDEFSFISQPVTVDYDLDFNADVVYFGTVIHYNTNDWGGQLKRLIINDEADSTQWVGTVTNSIGDDIDYADNVLFDLRPNGTNSIAQPISSAPTATVGEEVHFDIDGNGTTNSFDRERWVFVGTGRFFVNWDKSDLAQQSYYGIKEPYDLSTGFTWGEVNYNYLLDSTSIEVFNGKIVKNHPGFAGDTTWDLMINKMTDGTYNGWYLDFASPGERNLGQAALLGGLLTFTTYIPSSDVCTAEGTSRLYARWYQTGTSFYKPVFRIGNVFTDMNSNQTVDDGELKIAGDIDLGSGLALTPNIHTGREKGTTAYIQTSTGDIITISQGETGSTKSEKTSWLQRR